jgi:hypothetical protein
MPELFPTDVTPPVLLILLGAMAASLIANFTNGDRGKRLVVRTLFGTLLGTVAGTLMLYVSGVIS